MKCIYPFASMTAVMRASNALSRNNIINHSIQLDRSMTQRGCAFGIEIDCISSGEAERIMRKSGIKYRDRIEI